MKKVKVIKINGYDVDNDYVLKLEKNLQSTIEEILNNNNRLIDIYQSECSSKTGLITTTYTILYDSYEDL